MSISHNRRLKQTESTIDECADYEDEASFRELKLITEELPEKFRSVILLCWFEGCTAKEAAKILHISEGTVKFFSVAILPKMKGVSIIHIVLLQIYYKICNYTN